MNKTFIDLVQKKKTDRTPIWLMRQAGRYLPEYRKVRSEFENFMDFCFCPEAAAEVTIQPLKRFDLDAAIIFSDILVVPKAMGVDVKFIEKQGPVLNIKDITKIKEPNIEYFNKVGEAIALVKEEINKNHPTKTLIGFCGAPWTVAAYIIQGSGSRDYELARKFAYEREKEFKTLIDNITKASIKYLEIQIKNGAEVVKIFDSHAGVLNEKEFKKWVEQPNKKIVSSIHSKFPKIPVICFPRGAGTKYSSFTKEVGSKIIAIDQTVQISWAKKNLQGIIQGNLDNILLTADEKSVVTGVKNLIKEFGTTKYIFNLGHGLLPTTKIRNVELLIETIRKHEGRKNN